jgi:hypothetical protein
MIMALLVAGNQRQLLQLWLLSQSGLKSACFSGQSKLGSLLCHFGTCMLPLTAMTLTFRPKSAP